MSLVGGTSTTLLCIVFSISVFSRLKFLREQRGAEFSSLSSNRQGIFWRQATYLQLECVNCGDFILIGNRWILSNYFATHHCTLVARRLPWLTTLSQRNHLGAPFFLLLFLVISETPYTNQTRQDSVADNVLVGIGKLKSRSPTPWKAGSALVDFQDFILIYPSARGNIKVVDSTVRQIKHLELLKHDTR